MKIYDETIREELKLLAGLSGKALPPDKKGWEDDGGNGVVFQSDMAYELGSGNLAAVSEQVFSTDEDLVPEDGIFLYGPNLDEISENIPYGKLVILRVKEEAFSGKESYDLIRGIQHTRYHVHPKGFMTRVSAARHREPVRVSREAIEKGIDFGVVGSSYMEAYHKFPQVAAVKIIFITDPAFDYKAFEQCVLRSEQITEALDHVLKDFSMNCATCNLKAVCDEVEGMKELHFGRKL